MQHLSVRVVAAFHFWQIKGEFSFHGRTHAIHFVHNTTLGLYRKLAFTIS